jgi:glycosyltransferase involved in cell wall biosynthesis
VTADVQQGYGGPLVSVVIPAYNAMPFLPIAVGSALNQTHQRLEVVVVDDGSTDSTAAWTDALDDDRVRLVRRSNGGAGAARNTGIRASAGDYIAFLDADDYWEPEKIAAQVERVETADEPTLVDTWAYYIDAHGRKIGDPIGTHHEGDVWRHMVEQCLVRCGSTMLIPRQCFNDDGLFREDLSNAEDWEMWIRLTQRHPFAVVKQGLVGYRQHPNGKHRNYDGLLASMLRIVDLSLSNTMTSHRRLRRRSQANAHLHIARRLSADSSAGLRAIQLATQALFKAPCATVARGFLSVVRRTGQSAWDVARIRLRTLTHRGGRLTEPSGTLTQVAVDVDWQAPEASPYVRKLCHELSSRGFRFCRFWNLEGAPDLVHLHWPEACLGDPRLTRALLATMKVLVRVLAHRAQGTPILWTAHNLQHHERRHPLLADLFWTAFTRLVSSVIHLSEYGQAEALECHPALRQKRHFVIPHGHFIDDYPSMLSRDDARVRFNVADAKRVILFFGHIRPYKNVVALIDVCKTINDGTVLLVAGRPTDTAYTRQVAQAADEDRRVRLHLTHISDDDVPWLFTAADVVVLPFTRIHNSGSVLLALSMGRPAIAPHLPQLSWMVQHVGREWLRLYEPPLTSAALRTQPPRTAAPDLSHFSWEVIARQTVDAYAAVIAGTRRRRARRQVDRSAMGRARGV